MLSDWDALTMDEAGQSTNGISEVSPCGISLEVYEDWLNILDPKGWQANNRYPQPIIGIVREGYLTYSDWYIVATQQESCASILFAVWFVQDHKTNGMIGFSRLGFSESGEWQGIQPEHVRDFGKQLKRWARTGSVPDALTKVNLKEALRFNLGDRLEARKLQIPLPATPPGQAVPPMKSIGLPTAQKIAEEFHLQGVKT